MIKRYLVFDIGCIECSQDSGVIGTYDTEDEAEAVAGATAQHAQERDWTGQHYVEVYDLGESESAENHPEWEACKA